MRMRTTWKSSDRCFGGTRGPCEDVANAKAYETRGFCGLAFGTVLIREAGLRKCRPRVKLFVILERKNGSPIFSRLLTVDEPFTVVSDASSPSARMSQGVHLCLIPRVTLELLF